MNYGVEKMRIKIEFNMVNSAFEGNQRKYEIMRILETIAIELNDERIPVDIINYSKVLRDINGNSIGKIEFLEPKNLI